MGLHRGYFVSSDAPAYPVKIAAKMARDVRAVTQDEASAFITETKALHDKYCALLAKCNEIQRDLKVSEETVRLLQVTD